MQLKKFIIIIMFIVLVLSYIGLSSHYYYDRSIRQDIIKTSITNTVSDLNFAIFDLNRLLTIDGCNNITVNKVLLSRKLNTNRFLSAIALYKGETVVVNIGDNIKNIPSKIALGFGGKDVELAPYFKSYVTCYSETDKEDYVLIASVDTEKSKVFLDENFSEYLVVFVVYPIALFMIIGFLLLQFIFIPLKQLKKYTTEQGIIKPGSFTIAELEDLRQSTVDAFENLQQERTDLLKLARTDVLTGIGNRYCLNEHVNNLINDTSRKKQNFSLLFLNIDNFKSINDSLGYDIGDKVLIKVSEVITELLHTDDMFTRISGDEFIAVMNSINTDEKLERCISKIYNVLSVIEVDDAQMNITVSIGIAKYPEDGISVVSLLQRGNIALSKSKELGKNVHVFFNTSMLDATLYLIDITKDMATSLVKEEYELYYQPQINIQTNKIIGAEALIRWFKDTRFISPVEFIPIAEKTGFIVELGWWIIVTALKEKKLWETKGYDLTMSINIAANQFADTSFYEKFKFYIGKFGVNPSEIVLEITEYVFLNDKTELIETFTKLKKLGVSISLDDFGTGYSSLSYIKRFPIDAIKIDKSFIDDYHTEDGKVFLETIISMSINLGIDLVAEGVEEQEQLDFLLTRFCSKYQGYLCSAPIPSQAFQTLYENSLK